MFRRETYIVENARGGRAGEWVEEIVRGESVEEAGDLGDHSALPLLRGVLGCIVVPGGHDQAGAVRRYRWEL